MPVTIFVLIGSLFVSIISSNFELGLLIITCCIPYIFLEIREEIRDYQDQQYLNWLLEQDREEKRKERRSNLIECFLLIVCLIGLLVCAAFGGLDYFLIMASSCISAIAVLIVVLIDEFKRP